MGVWDIEVAEDHSYAAAGVFNHNSKEPNLQNFPSDDEDGIRRAFLVPDGKVRVFMDFSQVELRVLAFLSREPTMWHAFMVGEDVHSATSMRMFGKAEKSNRRVAKVINFGVAYGMTLYGIRDNLNKNADPEKGIPTIDDDQAGAFLNQWHGLFPRIGTWADELCLDMLKRYPASYTGMFGRTRRIPNLRAAKAEGRRAKRQAVASMVQGTAAELTKESLVRLQALCDWGRATSRWEAQIVTTIHDEIQIDVDPHGAAEFAWLAKQEMERFPQFAPLPIIVEAEWSATTWADKKPVWEKPK